MRPSEIVAVTLLLLSVSAVAVAAANLWNGWATVFALGVLGFLAALALASSGDGPS